jgi:hypothetical protein
MPRWYNILRTNKTSYVNVTPLLCDRILNAFKVSLSSKRLFFYFKNDLDLNIDNFSTDKKLYRTMSDTDESSENDENLIDDKKSANNKKLNFTGDPRSGASRARTGD